MPRRPLPGHVAGHRPLLQPPPGSRVGPQRRGAGEREAQALDGHRREHDAGGDAVVQCGLVGVDHGVGEPADARHDRDGAVAQAVELGEAAGLEARGHQDGVGPALQQVGERLVIAEDAADPAGMRLRRRGEARLDGRVARAQDRQLAAMGQQRRQGAQQEVQALLLGQAADDDAQKCLGIGVEPEALLQGSAVGRGLEPPCIVARGQVGVVWPGPRRRGRCRWRCRPDARPGCAGDRAGPCRRPRSGSRGRRSGSPWSAGRHSRGRP